MSNWSRNLLVSGGLSTSFWGDTTQCSLSNGSFLGLVMSLLSIAIQKFSTLCATYSASLIPSGSAGTESTGGSQWTLLPAIRASCWRPEDVPPAKPLREFNFILSSVSLFPLRFLRGLQWPAGLKVTRYGKRKEEPKGAGHSAWVSQQEHLLLQVDPCLQLKKNKKTEEASSENMSTFQLRASECWDNVVIRKCISSNFLPTGLGEKLGGGGFIK